MSENVSYWKMQKFLKISAWVFAVLSLSILGVFAALKLYFTPTRITALVTSYAKANLKRDVSLGSAALTLRGFDIKNLKVSEYPDFKKGEFFSVEEFSIRPNLRALLRRQLKISSVFASALKVNVMEVAKNTYNFSDLLNAPQIPGDKAPDADRTVKNIAVHISNINLKNSSLSYISAASTMAVTLYGIKLNANSVISDGFFPFETDFKMKVKSPYLSGDFPSHIKGSLDLAEFALQKGKAKIEAASIKAGNIDCELKGELEGLLAPAVRLTLGIKPFSSSDLKTYFPAVPPRIPIPAVEAVSNFNLTTSSVVFKNLDFKTGPVEGSLKGNLSWDPVFDYAIDAKLKIRSPEMMSDALTVNFPIVPKGFHLPAADVYAEAAIKPGNVKLETAKISAASLAAIISGALVQSPFSASGMVKISTADIQGLAAIAPFLKPYELKGKAGGVLNIKFIKKLLLSGKFGFKDIGTKFSGNELSALRGGITVSKNSLKSKSISGKLNGSKLKLGFSANNYLTHPQAVLNLDLAALQLAVSTQPAKAESAGDTKATQKPAAANPFSFDLKGASRLGAISHPQLTTGEVSLKYDLKNISEDLKTLSGQASFDVKGGKLDNVCELAEKYKVAKVALYPMVILSVASKTVKGVKLPDFNTIVFAKMEGDYIFQNGLMKIQKSNLDSDMADAVVSGSINLATEALDMRISVKLKRASGISMSVPVVMIVKGTFSAPSVKVDVKSVLDQPVVKKNLKILSEQGSKLLEGLFKKKKK